MASNALLVVSNIKQIGKTLRAIGKNASSLYIHLNIPVEARQQPLPSWCRMISQLYVDSNQYCDASMDMRILVSSIREATVASGTPHTGQVDKLFSDAHFPEVCNQLCARYNISTEPIYLQTNACNDIADFQNAETSLKVYDNVILGGTFDRIHLGHKIFLTQAVLRTCRRLIIGVTTSKLTHTKTLSELILPVEQRIQDVRNFLQTIDSSLQYEIVPIDDPFGPTQTDPKIDMIVVSAETLRGGHKCNEIRANKNLNKMEIHCVELLESSSNKVEGIKEWKESSSNTRIDLLGTRLIAPTPRPHLASRPYIIGLTGCIAAGKSKMAQRFAQLGATVFDCDKIAHEIYEPGQLCFQRIREHFGADILNAAGFVDRAKLGEIVFNDAAQLTALNAIVWPELMLEIKRRIAHLQASEDCPRVVVLEAAVLFRAGWESECHEVWSMIVPTEMAVQRVMERNKLSETEARQRVDSQLSNSELVSKSNVVFSSQWSEDFTKKQAEKAWQMLMSELQSKETQLTNCNL